MNYSWKLDNFDTEILGFRVAKILDLKSDKSSQDLINDLTQNNIDYAIFRIEAHKVALIQFLQKLGFVIVDGVISLEISLKEQEITGFTDNVREAIGKDLEELEQITSGLYLLSRVYNDPLISRKSADEFFLRWIENSIKGNAADSVLVWEEEGKILGYITLQKKGQIPLVGVSKEARGKGIGKSLLLSSFGKFREWKTEKVIIETQISNIAALRMDLDCGFKPVNSYLTLRWANNSSDR